MRIGLRHQSILFTFLLLLIPSIASASTVTGYWHNFDNGSSVLKLRDVPRKYHIVAIAFGEGTRTPGQVVLNLDPTLSARLGGYTKQEFISDIATLKGRGQIVIISVGGQNGHVSVTSSSEANAFANSINRLMSEYGFQGVDIDLEHGINATYMTQALNQISGVKTMAPQTLDMQNPNNEYFKLARNTGALVNTQYYNSGSMLGCDGRVYSSGNVDFLTALACIQLQNGISPDKVGLGLPATSRAAGSGYVSPSVVNNAISCLRSRTNCGSFVPPRTWPVSHAMTWSINWDNTSGYNWVNTVSSGGGGGGGGPPPPSPPPSPPPPQPGTCVNWEPNLWTWDGVSWTGPQCVTEDGGVTEFSCKPRYETGCNASSPSARPDYYDQIR